MHYITGHDINTKPQSNCLKTLCQRAPHPPEFAPPPPPQVGPPWGVHVLKCEIWVGAGLELFEQETY